jgi:hypothetical protein
MAAKQCYHCGVLVTDPKTHDCWTTTEENLTQDLPDDLRDAWERLRETASGFGEQRIYASHNSIMFSRKACYFFVRPKKNVLEVCIFLGRTVRDPRVRRSEPSSKAKVGHLIHVKHRDEVESPITDWLREAYQNTDQLTAAARGKPAKKTAKKKITKKKTARKSGKKAARKSPTKKKAPRRG